MNVEQARFNMIEQQIRPWDVLDSHVLDLLAAVRREDFVPAAHRQLAFADLQIPLKPGPQAVALGQGHHGVDRAADGRAPTFGGVRHRGQRTGQPPAARLHPRLPRRLAV